MSYHVAQSSQPAHEITHPRNHCPLDVIGTAVFHTTPPHLRNETFYFDTIDEANEFRECAAAIKLKYHPELCALQVRQVTRDDLQDFASFIENEIARIKCGVKLKKCYVCVDRLPYYSWLLCGRSKRCHV